MNSTHRSLRSAAPLVLVVATAVACSSASGARPTPGNSSRPGAHNVTTAHRSRPTHRERTERLVAHQLAALRLPHDARSRSHAPVRALAHGRMISATSHVIEHHRFWTMPGTPRHVLDFVRRHQAAACRFSGSGSVSGPHQSTVHEIMCDRSSTGYAYQPEVEVEAVAMTHGSAVRADASAIWFPHRPVRSYVHSPSRAGVVVRRDPTIPGYHRLPTVRRDVGAAGAARIAAVVDRLQVYPPIVEACPADFAGLQDTVHFMTSRGPATVVVSLSGCPGVEVTIGHHRTALLGAGAVDAVVRRVLHLPRRYRY